MVTLTISQAAGRREECDFRRTAHGNPIPDPSLSLPQPPAENQDRRGKAKPRSMRELEASAALMVCFYLALAGGAAYTVAANEGVSGGDDWQLRCYQNHQWEMNEWV